MNEAVAEVAKAVAMRSASGFSTRWAPKKPGLGAAPRLGTNGSGSTSQAASRDSITATSAATAANESWKLTPRMASGSIATTARTAKARLRMVSARRSMITAPSTISVMISARSVPTREPVAMS